MIINELIIWRTVHQEYTSWRQYSFSGLHHFVLNRASNNKSLKTCSSHSFIHFFFILSFFVLSTYGALDTKKNTCDDILTKDLSNNSDILTSKISIILLNIKKKRMKKSEKNKKKLKLKEYLTTVSEIILNLREQGVLLLISVHPSTLIINY